MAITTIQRESWKREKGSNKEAKGEVHLFVDDDDKLKLKCKFKVSISGVSGSVTAAYGMNCFRYNSDKSEMIPIFGDKKTHSVGATLSGSNSKKWDKIYTFSGPQVNDLKDSDWIIAFYVNITSDSPGIWTSLDDIKDDISDIAAIVSDIAAISDGVVKIYKNWKIIAGDSSKLAAAV